MNEPYCPDNASVRSKDGFIKSSGLQIGVLFIRPSVVGDVCEMRGVPGLSSIEGYWLVHFARTTVIVPCATIDSAMQLADEVSRSCDAYALEQAASVEQVLAVLGPELVAWIDYFQCTPNAVGFRPYREALAPLVQQLQSS